MSKPHEGRVALVTGSSRNLGRAIVEMLASEGASVVIHFHSDGSQSDAESAADLIRSNGGKAIVEQADLSSVAAIEELFAKVRERLGRLDVLVNNAGMVLKKPLVDFSESEYDKLFNINAKAAFFCMKEAARCMEDEGRIINIATTILGATTGMYSAYAGSKAPLEAFTRALGKELVPRGITVNAIAPGPLDTQFYYSAETEDSVSRIKGLNLLGDIKDIVPLVKFIASPEARWITAQTIFINGGYVAR